MGEPGSRSRSFRLRLCYFQSLTVISTVPSRGHAVFCFSFSLPGSVSQHRMKLSVCTVWQHTLAELSANLSSACSERHYLFRHDTLGQQEVALRIHCTCRLVHVSLMFSLSPQLASTNSANSSQTTAADKGKSEFCLPPL